MIVGGFHKNPPTHPSRQREVKGVRWYWIALLVCLVIGPFDALYVYIKAQKRRDERKRREREQSEQTHGEEKAP